MSERAQQMRGIAGRMVASSLGAACDLEAFVGDVLQLHRLADEMERLEEALRPRTRREFRRHDRRLRRRIARVIRLVWGV